MSGYSSSTQTSVNDSLWSRGDAQNFLGLCLIRLPQTFLTKGYMYMMIHTVTHLILIFFMLYSFKYTYRDVFSSMGIKIPGTDTFFHFLELFRIFELLTLPVVMITYNIYIVIRETGQFSSKGIINDFIGNLNRLTVSRRFTEQAV